MRMSLGREQTTPVLVVQVLAQARAGAVVPNVLNSDPMEDAPRLVAEGEPR